MDKLYWNNVGKNVNLINLTKEDFVKILDGYYGNIFVADANGIIVYVNNTYYVSLGLEPTDFIGRHVSYLRKEGIYNKSVTLEVLEKKEEVQDIVINSYGEEIYVHAVPIFEDNDEIKYVVQFAKKGKEIEGFIELIKINKEKMENYLMALKYVTGKNDDNLIYSSNAMQKVCDLAKAAAKSDGNILIQGESGTGKEIIARYICNNSYRSHEAYIPINCAAIPENLIESELFGYAPGAFTGAQKQGKPGFFELAHKGIIFLDEIGDMPLHTQSKLLRILETGELVRVGGMKPQKIDVQVICATNKNLKLLVEQNKFREDLYYRLNILPIILPPLRERKDDINILINYFLSLYNHKYNKSISLSKICVESLENYDWPGNVRELKNLIHRLVIITEGGTVYEVPGLQRQTINNETINKFDFRGGLKQVIADYERKYITAVVADCKNNITEAAKKLGVNRSLIYRKLK